MCLHFSVCHVCCTRLYLMYGFFFIIYSAVVDVIMSWKAWHNMSPHVKLRYVLKVVSAAAWVIVLPVTYAYSWKNTAGIAMTIRNWFGNGASSPSFFIIASLIYLSPNMLSGLLFLFPFIRRYLEKSDYKIFRLIRWWSQVYNHMNLSWIISVRYFF